MADNIFTLRETGVAAADEMQLNVGLLIQAIKDWDLAAAVEVIEQLYSDISGLTEAMGTLWLAGVDPDVVPAVDTPDDIAEQITEALERHGIAKDVQ